MLEWLGVNNYFVVNYFYLNRSSLMKDIDIWIHFVLKGGNVLEVFS